MSRGRTRAGAFASLAAIALATLLPAGAAADDRPYLAFGPVRNGRPALTRQLRQAVCAAAECVPWGAVAEGRSFHVARARAAGIAGVLVGSVERSGGRPLLTLLLFVEDRRPAARWRLALTRQGLASGRDVRELVAALGRRLGGAAAPELTPPASRAPASGAAPVDAVADAAPDGARTTDQGADARRAVAPRPGAPLPAAPVSPPPAAYQPPPVAAPPVPAPSAPLPLPSPPRLVGPSETGDDAPEPAVMRLPAMTFSGSSGRSDPAAAARSGPEEGRAVPTDPPWLAVEAGAVFARSSLSFQGATASPGPLRGHDLPALVAPRVGLELQPAAWFTAGALAGLSLQGRLAMAVGAQTDVAARSHETSMSWASAGLAWRSAPPLGPRPSVSAAVSWERREVAVKPPVPGLADRRLSGGKVGLGASLPLGRAPFFPGGKAWGLDADAGLALRLTGTWSVQVGAEYASTWYRFDRDPEGVYGARAAREELLSAQTSIRFELR